MRNKEQAGRHEWQVKGKFSVSIPHVLYWKVQCRKWYRVHRVGYPAAKSTAFSDTRGGLTEGYEKITVSQGKG